MKNSFKKIIGSCFYVSIILIMCSISCKMGTSDTTVNSDPDKTKLLSFILSSFLQDQVDYYSICGNFFHEFDDSVMRKKLLLLPDSIAGSKDIDTLVKQFSAQKYDRIDMHLDVSDFIQVGKIDDYKQANFYRVHFIISPPMFTKNKDLCLFYIHATLNDKGQTGVFLPFFKNNGNSWDFYHAILDTAPYNEEGYHYHEYTLVDSLIFYNIKD